MTNQHMYMVLLYRTDRQNPIILVETDNEQEANDILNGAEDEWFNSSQEKRPFRLKKPYRSSFLPSLIYEVKLESMSLEEYEQRGFVEKMTNGQSFANSFNPSNFGR